LFNKIEKKIPGILNSANRLTELLRSVNLPNMLNYRHSEFYYKITKTSSV